MGACSKGELITHALSIKSIVDPITILAVVGNIITRKPSNAPGPGFNKIPIVYIHGHTLKTSCLCSSVLWEKIMIDSLYF